MNYWLILIPLISAFIGWFTNWIAIKMLFHPKEPKKILGITFHGIFPKRQQQFAQKLGKLVSEELLSFKEIEEKIISPDNLSQMMPLVEEKIDLFRREKLSSVFPMISMFIGQNTINQLKVVFMKELETMFPEIIGSYMKNIESQLDLEKMVTEKVSGFSSDKMEIILNRVNHRYFTGIDHIIGCLNLILPFLFNKYLTFNPKA